MTSPFIEVASFLGAAVTNGPISPNVLKQRELWEWPLAAALVSTESLQIILHISMIWLDRTLQKLWLIIIFFL